MTDRVMLSPVFSDTAPSTSEIIRPTELRAALRRAWETGISGGESTGWPSLDPFYNVREREWTLITGIPGHGKSAFLDGLMVNLAKNRSWRWGVFSAENMPHERHMADLAAQYIGRPFNPGIRTRISNDDFQKAMLFMDSYFVFLNPSEEMRNIDRVLDLAEYEMVHGDGLNGLVIDPWNELDHSRPSNMNETEYVSRALSKVRRFAREHEIHVFLVAHPTKLQRIKATDGSEANIYPVPTPYDVSGSAHFRNKADNCLCVWRDVANPAYGADVYIQKIRFREVGQVGMVHMGYDGPTNTLIDGIRPTREPGDEDGLR